MSCFTFLLIISLVIGIGASSCNEGWTSFNGKCYGFGSTFATWADATAICNGFGASLATIESAEENEFLKNLSRDKDADKVWVGGSDMFSEGVWVWTSTGTAIELYMDWDSNEPNNYGGREDCMALRKSEEYRWNDARCMTVGNFICETDWKASNFFNVAPN